MIIAVTGNAAPFQMRPKFDLIFKQALIKVPPCLPESACFLYALPGPHAFLQSRSNSFAPRSLGDTVDFSLGYNWGDGCWCDALGRRGDEAFIHPCVWCDPLLPLPPSKVSLLRPASYRF